MLAEIVAQFSPADLAGQFILSREAPDVGWPVDSVAGWHLAVEGRLPRLRLRQEGRTVGWLLGQAITPEGRVVAADVELPRGDVESFIYAHGGRFLVILPVLGRVYLDPFGLLSAVYCAHQGIVAATPGLIPYDGRSPDRAELIRQMGLPEARNRFGLGMTSRENVERILPNHYLDLGTWRTVRHWPDRERLPPVAAADAVAEICEITRNQLRAVHAHGPTTLQITAGRDSRSLLACSRAIADEIDCLTIDLNDDTSKPDVKVGPEVARLAGVRHHRLIGWREPDPRDMALWLYRTGFCVGEPRGQKVTTTMCQIDPKRSLIYASVSEMFKIHLWRPNDAPETRISGERLVYHAKGIATAEAVARGEEWRQAAPLADALQLLTLFWVEHSIGCWAGIWSYAAYCDTPVFPMAHRRVIELAMGLPAEKLWKKDLAVDIIRQEWPELLRVPLNPPTLRQRVGRARKGLRDAVWYLRTAVQRR
jgi:hypothetical protein